MSERDQGSLECGVSELEALGATLEALVERIVEHKLLQELEGARVSGFLAGWAAALSEFAKEMGAQCLRARIAAGGRAVSLSPEPLIRMIEKRAETPPPADVVEQHTGVKQDAATTPTEAEA